MCPHPSALPTECTQVLEQKQSRGWICPVWGRTNPNWNWRVPASKTEPKQRLGNSSSKCEGQTWKCLIEPSLGLLKVFLGAIWEAKCLKILLMPKALQRGAWKVLLSISRGLEVGGNLVLDKGWLLCHFRRAKLEENKKAHGKDWSYLLIYLFQTLRQQAINVHAYELRHGIGAEVLLLQSLLHCWS